MFLLTSNFRPQGVVSPCSGAIYMYKIMIFFLIKSDFKEIFLNLKQMTEVTKGFCWHQNFVPWGCLHLTCSYIHLLNHEKMCIKSEVEEILFKPATNDHSDEAFPLTSKFWPLWVVCPCLRAIFYFFSSITTDFNISSALRWAIQDQWSSGFWIKLCVFGLLPSKPWSCFSDTELCLGIQACGNETS